MLDSERHCGSSSSRERTERRERSRPAAARAAAVVAVALAVAFPGSASAYRRGLASYLGGATLETGHVVWVDLGYPGLGGGWGLAVHPVIDLELHAAVVLGHPAQVDRLVFGGGGGVAARFGLLRGRTSLALSARLGATGYGEGSGAAALVDLLSPGVDLSFRLGPEAALHAGLRVVLEYVTDPADFVGGFEARAGFSLRLTEHLGLVGSVAAGGTIWSPYGEGTARVQVSVGLEYLFARQDEES